MIRALIEILMTIAVAMLARAILSSIVRGIGRASSASFAPPSASAGNSSGPQQRQTPTSSGGDLFKDPVCGTYVAQSSALRRQSGNQVFYYCSEACREKHALVAR